MFRLFQNFFSPPRDLILVVAAIWIGLWLAEKRSLKYKISISDLNNIAFYPLLGYILGGRILYALENFSAFAQNPKSLISLNLDLFDPYGGLAVALIVALVYGKRKNLSLWPTLDALTPLFAVITLGLGLAHLASGSAFGKATSLPWAIQLWGETRHPSQIYEIIASLLILGLLLFRKTDSRPGIHFLIFTAFTSGTHLFLEAFRGDSTLILGGIRMEQIITWIILAISLYLLEIKSKNSPISLATRKNG